MQDAQFAISMEIISTAIFHLVHQMHPCIMSLVASESNAWQFFAASSGGITTHRRVLLSLDLLIGC